MKIKTITTCDDLLRLCLPWVASSVGDGLASCAERDGRRGLVALLDASRVGKSLSRFRGGKRFVLVLLGMHVLTVVYVVELMTWKLYLQHTNSVGERGGARSQAFDVRS
jgi:hypothetical protein